jgi:hypothetical protein
VGSPIAMERIAPKTSATAETPTWMVCLGFAIPLRVVGEVAMAFANLRPTWDPLGLEELLK